MLYQENEKSTVIHSCNYCKDEIIEGLQYLKVSVLRKSINANTSRLVVDRTLTDDEVHFLERCESSGFDFVIQKRRVAEDALNYKEKLLTLNYQFTQEELTKFMKTEPSIFVHLIYINKNEVVQDLIALSLQDLQASKVHNFSVGELRRWDKLHWMQLMADHHMGAAWRRSKKYKEYLDWVGYVYPLLLQANKDYEDLTELRSCLPE